MQSEVQKHLDKAAAHYSINELKEALKHFSQAFDYLVDEASAYARSHPGASEDREESGESVRVIKPLLFVLSKKYLQKDQTAYLIQKNMASIFDKFNDKESAKHCLEQAIELAPPGSDVSQAQNGLENLKIKM